MAALSYQNSRPLVLRDVSDPYEPRLSWASRDSISSSGDIVGRRKRPVSPVLERFSQGDRTAPGPNRGTRVAVNPREYSVSARQSQPDRSDIESIGASPRFGSRDVDQSGRQPSTEIQPQSQPGRRSGRQPSPIYDPTLSTAFEQTTTADMQPQHNDRRLPPISALIQAVREGERGLGPTRGETQRYSPVRGCESYDPFAVQPASSTSPRSSSSYLGQRSSRANTVSTTFSSAPTSPRHPSSRYSPQSSGSPLQEQQERPGQIPSHDRPTTAFSSSPLSTYGQPELNWAPHHQYIRSEIIPGMIQHQPTPMQPLPLQPNVMVPNLPNPFAQGVSPVVPYPFHQEGVALREHGYNPVPVEMVKNSRPYDFGPMVAFGFGANGPNSALGHNRRRRGNLPREATKLLRQWFDDHSDSPYPTEEDKNLLCQSTGLQMTQVNNWFINARRRIQRDSSQRHSRRPSEDSISSNDPNQIGGERPLSHDSNKPPTTVPVPFAPPPSDFVTFR